MILLKKPCPKPLKQFGAFLCLKVKNDKSDIFFNEIFGIFKKNAYLCIVNIKQ